MQKLVHVQSESDAEFNAAFPCMNKHLARCHGSLAVACGAHSYDSSAWLTFHSCSPVPFVPSPVVVRIMIDVSDALSYQLNAALCDLEACLAWMENEGGPCELYLCHPDGVFWESASIVDLQGVATAPRQLRGGASPMVALMSLPWGLAFKQGSSTLAMIDVPGSGTYLGYDAGAHFPRLMELVTLDKEACDSGRQILQVHKRRSWIGPPSLSTKSSPEAMPSHWRAAAAASTARRGGFGGLERLGFSVGTAMAGSQCPCAELVRNSTVTWELRADRMRSANAALAALELELPAVVGERHDHAALCMMVAERGSRARAQIHYPSVLSIEDVFPPATFPPDDFPRAVQNRESPDDHESDVRARRANLLARPPFRSGVFFNMCVEEAEAKLATGSTLDVLDLTVLHGSTVSSNAT